MGKANHEVICYISKVVTTVGANSCYNGRLSSHHLNLLIIYVPTLKSGWFDDDDKNDMAPACLVDVPLLSQLSGCEKIMYTGVPANKPHLLPAGEQGSL